MSLKRKIFLFHCFFCLIFLVGFFTPKTYYWAILAFNVFFLAFVFYLRNINSGLRKYIYFILPGLFLNSLFLYLSLLANKFYLILILLLGVSLSYYYFKELRKKLVRDADLSAGSFLGWADTVALLLVFFTASFSYALTYFLNISNYILILIILLALFLGIWQSLLFLGTKLRPSLLFSFLFVIALLPIAWVLFFLPFSYNILGLIISICYYFGLSFIRFNLTNSLSIKKIKYNLAFMLMSLLVLLAMIKWR